MNLKYYKKINILNKMLNKEQSVQDLIQSCVENFQNTFKEELYNIADLWVGNKDIRREHILERMIKGHYFDKDFEN